MDVVGLANRLRGKFIVLDGPDGCGKTTQRDMLERALIGAGIEVMTCRDPGGTAIGDRIRSVLLDFDLSEMNVNCEALLFMASRAQLMHEIIRPALREGKAVLCSRFVSSTCAYQGAAGYDSKRIIELARFAIDDTWPDWTIVLDVDVEKGFERIGRRSHHAGKHRRRFSGQPTLFQEGDAESATDAMEARPIEFHRRVRKNFLELDAVYPSPVCHIGAEADEETVPTRILECLDRVTS